MAITEITLSDADRLIFDSPCQSRKVYVGTVGLRLLWSTGIDLTTATSTVVLVKRPDGTTTTWAAAPVVYAGEQKHLLYVTQANDLLQCGVYEFQPRIIINGQTIYARTNGLTLHKLFT